MNPTDSPRDLALVGAGYWGKNLARNFNALGALHTLCDNQPSTLAAYGSDYTAVRKTTRLDDVLADPAGVSRGRPTIDSGGSV